MKSETFTASLDAFTKTITWLVIILFTGLGIQCLVELSKAAGNGQVLAVQGAVLFLLAAILIGSYLVSPRAYVLRADELVIKRPARDKTIKLQDLTQVRILKETEMAWTIRTFGVGGLFGHYGKYYNSALGSFTQYATRRNHQVLLQTRQGKKIIITPDNLELADKLQSARLQPV